MRLANGSDIKIPDCCPKCKSQIAQAHLLNQDDDIVQITVKCRRINFGKKKKGCGYSQTFK